jgi:hypothetical protein
MPIKCFFESNMFYEVYFYSYYFLLNKHIWYPIGFLIIIMIALKNNASTLINSNDWTRIHLKGDHILEH